MATTTLEDMMEIVFDNQTNLGNGDYLKLMEHMKNLYETINKKNIHSRNEDILETEIARQRRTLVFYANRLDSSFIEIEVLKEKNKKLKTENKKLKSEKNDVKKKVVCEWCHKTINKNYLKKHQMTKLCMKHR